MAVMECISTTTFDSNSALTVQFGASGALLPTDYQDLQIRMSGQAEATSRSYWDRIIFYFGYGATPTFDSSSAYTYKYMHTGNATKGSYMPGSSGAFVMYYWNSNLRSVAGQRSNPAYANGENCFVVVDIMDYNSTVKTKNCMFSMGNRCPDDGIPGNAFGGGSWDNVSEPITAVKLSVVYAGFTESTAISLYGLKGAN